MDVRVLAHPDNTGKINVGNLYFVTITLQIGQVEREDESP